MSAAANTRQADGANHRVRGAILPKIETALRRVERSQAGLNAFTALTRERALLQARLLDARREAGETMPPLAGKSFAAKNLFDIEGLPTLAGSATRMASAVAISDAEAVRRLSEAGCILLGAANMDEFAYGFTTENAHFGSTRNPHDPSRTAGGSSGGSAAAVAAGLVDLALGSDTNGSIRVPAALCGIFGFKPTYGRISTEGVFPFVRSLDHAGLFARTAGELATASHILLDGDDEPVKPIDRTKAGGGLRIGISSGYFGADLSKEVGEALAGFLTAFPGAGRVDLRFAAESRAAAFLITASEGGTRHADLLRRRYLELGPSTRERLAAGMILPAEWISRAYRVRELFRRQVIAAFDRYDILLAPATPCVAPKLGQENIVIGGREMPARASLGLYTQPLTPVGMPIVTAPLANVRGLPVGVQIIAAPHRDALALEFAAYLEEQGLVTATALPPARTAAVRGELEQQEANGRSTR